MASKRKKRRSYRVLITVICFGLGVLIALQMKNVSNLRSLNLLGNESVDSLREQVRQLSVVNNELKNRNESLNESLEELIRLGNNEDAQLNIYKQEVERLSIYAGLTAVKGPGLIIDIDLNQAGASISAGNLLTIINAIKSSGYAISVNGQRIVALSDINATGSAENPNIIVNGTNISDPDGYEIRVIGEEGKMRDFVSFHTGVWDRLKASGLTINFHFPTEVEIPALAKDSPAFRQELLEPVE